VSGAKPVQMAGSHHAPNAPGKPSYCRRGAVASMVRNGEGRKARNSRRKGDCAAITLAAFREPERRVTSGDHCTARFAHCHHRSLNDGVTVNVWCRCHLDRQGTGAMVGNGEREGTGEPPDVLWPSHLVAPSPNLSPLQEKSGTWSMLHIVRGLDCASDLVVTLPPDRPYRKPLQSHCRQSVDYCGC
jgi:hypothetical protein